MKNLYALMLVVAIGLAGCGKKTASPGTSSGNFQPATAGSQWNYAISENFNPSSSLLMVAAEAQLGTTFPSFDTSYSETLTALSRDTSIGGLQYSIISPDSVANNNNVYTTLQGTDYYGIGVVLAGVGGVGTELPVLYLKDQPAGTTWMQSVISTGATPDTTLYTITINSINGSKMVGGTTYSGVTAETIKVLPGGLTALASGAGIPSGVDLSLAGNYYFARGVGLIEVDVNSSLYGFQYTQTLTSSSIIK
jgi:hypothetical protein